jgi:hypothetical protein
MNHVMHGNLKEGETATVGVHEEGRNSMPNHIDLGIKSLTLCHEEILSIQHTSSRGLALLYHSAAISADCKAMKK